MAVDSTTDELPHHISAYCLAETGIDHHIRSCIVKTEAEKNKAVLIEY